MSDPILRETNPFPDLLLVVLTLCNVIALVTTTVAGLFLLAMGAGRWLDQFTVESVLGTVLFVAVPILLVVGPVLTWIKRSWPFEMRVAFVVLPLAYLAFVTSLHLG